MIKVPCSRKREIRRDLSEIFSSGAEHGESCQEIIARLGPPEEFAKCISDEIGVPYGSRSTLSLILGLCSMAFGIILTAIYMVTSTISGIPTTAFGVIGGADGPTQIYLTSNFEPLLLVVGLIFISLSIFLIAKYIKRR